MRHPSPLTDEQKEFITANRSKLTFMEMTVELGLNSPYKIQRFCESAGLGKSKKELTDTQKQFIRDNYLSMYESKIVAELGVSRFCIQNFKREEGLAKNIKHRDKKKRGIVREGNFNVNLRENWIM